jgi:anti-sigma factor RsiW
MMYLADELPARDKQIVETRLAGDAALRAELEELRAAHERIGREILELDRSDPISAAEQMGLRQVTRAIRQWQADRAREAMAAAPAHSRRATWWLYPAAGAVAAIIVYTVWWGFQPAEPGSLKPTLRANDPPNWVRGDERQRPYFPVESSTLDEAELELDQVKMLRTINDLDEQDAVI